MGWVSPKAHLETRISAQVFYSGGDLRKRGGGGGQETGQPIQSIIKTAAAEGSWGLIPRETLGNAIKHPPQNDPPERQESWGSYTSTPLSWSRAAAPKF